MNFIYIYINLYIYKLNLRFKKQIKKLIFLILFVRMQTSFRVDE